MSKALEARDFIMDFLRKEIVGPHPVHPYVQQDGEEALRLQDSPRQRYGAGVLFPMRSQVLSQDETADDEDSDANAESPDSDESVEATDRNNNVASSSIQGDPVPDTDYDVTLANQYLPSAMGISALVELPEVLSVTVSVGVYSQGVIEIKNAENDAEPTERTPAWLRRPLVQTVELQASDLVGASTIRVERPIAERDGQTSLALHIVSRPYADGTDSNRTRLITFTIINRLTSDRTPSSKDCYFQCSLSAKASTGAACFLGYPEPERSSASDDFDEMSLMLLHLDNNTFAVGHGCAADWDEPTDARTTMIRTEVLPTYEVKPVLPTQIKGLHLSMLELASEDLARALELCTRLADGYEEWIETRESEVEARSDLSDELRGTARTHMENCRKCLLRMRDGIELLRKDSDVAFAFRLMNESMLMQQIHYEISSQESRPWRAASKTSRQLVLSAPFEVPAYDDPERAWRPFQLAFILMNLRSLVEPHSPDREIVDVIWFPTGGGKTEAYLGLSAFSLFLRRLRNREDAGTSVLMRYTLRLLTTQQFQRAATLICACEALRRREAARLGSERFTIGLWVGGAVTPNRESEALNTLNELLRGQGQNKFILLSCPWCGAGMGPHRIGQATQCPGYRRVGRPARVRYICGDSNCEFGTPDGLPVAVIDEQIYDDPPSLLIGTVDKFALLPFRPEARSLFGIDTPYSPPDLVIQDELHLITGPLGSMVGHYETVIDALTCREEADSTYKAKIIGSTATISRAHAQVNNLYGRDTFLFPPQALSAGDSFFAEERTDVPGRMYMGVCATALTSHVTSQIRVMSALLQSARLFFADNPARADAVDPYWTMMGYFNSLRELGHAATLIQADIREYLNAMWDRLGLRHETVRKLPVDPRRFINRTEELTSRIPSHRIPDVLQRLFARHTGTENSDALDVCFATNMIQVGIDIPRLSLMTIVGQPKTASEYIQASSRIGRQTDTPGIVVTNFNPFKSRDRSHYEHFRPFHEKLYRHVEPSSVTPFSVPVRERALHALIVTLCRMWGDDGLRSSPFHVPDQQLQQKIRDTILERVVRVDRDECKPTSTQIDEFFTHWEKAPRSLYGGFQRPSEDLPLLHPAGRAHYPGWPESPYLTPSSMRNVDADCAAMPMGYEYDGDIDF